MKRATIGLDIGSSAVRAAEVVMTGGKPTIRAYAEVALPAGAVRGGEVVDAAAVTAAVKALWNVGHFHSRKAVVGVANQRVVVREIELPWVEPKEVAASLQFQVGDYIPMPIDQALLDYHLLNEFTDEFGARRMRLLLVAAARDMVVNTLGAVERAGLTVTAVDLNPFALLRCSVELDHLGLGGESAEALIDVGASVTNIVVHQNGTPRFVRVLLRGGEYFTEAVADWLGVSFDTAEQLKLEATAGDDPTDLRAEAVQRALSTATDDFVEDVRGSLDYYNGQPNATRLSGVRLTGGGCRIGDLAERLAATLRLPVGSTSHLEFSGRPVAAMAVGLAVGEAA